MYLVDWFFEKFVLIIWFIRLYYLGRNEGGRKWSLIKRKIKMVVMLGKLFLRYVVLVFYGLKK